MSRKTHWMLRALALYGAVLVCVAPAAAAPQPVLTDVRILIDVSGSMKKNDPENLRAPALRLVVGLLPAGTRAGVWTFGQYVNMQVPFGEVDAIWKERAARGAAAIHSRGLFTNIEDALERSTWDLRTSDPQVRRSIILLTDGMVDVSKNAADNAASRARILDASLRRLRDAGVALHAIALSERADHALLRRLAAETDGSYEQIDDAARLQRVFLHMFERTARPDTLPMDGNRFSVDQSISEMTVLAFKESADKPVRLITPEGREIAAGNAPDGFTWRSEQGYELITVQKPATGEWRAVAEVDPDNRVMVVTDLKLNVDGLPGRMLPDEPLTVRAFLSDQGKPITKPGFLAVVKMELIEWETLSKSQTWRPQSASGDGAAPADGVFTFALPAPRPEGLRQLVLRADGGTFVRELRHSLNIEWPVRAHVEALPGEPQGRHVLRVAARDELLQAGTLQVDATLVTPSGKRTPLAAEPGDAGQWRAQTPPLIGTGEYLVEVAVKALTHRGDAFERELAPLSVQGMAAEPPPPEATAPAPAPVEAAETQTDPPAESAADPQPEEPATDLIRVDEGDPPNWLVTGVTLLVLNLVLVATPGGIWWFLRRRSRQAPEPDLDSDAEPAPAA